MNLELEREPALQALLGLYGQRPDLQEVYPEALGGDFRRLIDWAAGVARRSWEDSSYPVLTEHLDWLIKHATGTPPLLSPLFQTIQHTSSQSVNPMPQILAIIQHESSSNISEHLPILSMLITEFRLRHIVELGSYMGTSTLALLEAVQNTGGMVMSIDILPCAEAQRRVKEAGLHLYWRFLQANDLELHSDQILQPIDLLFIDTNHLYEHTIAELKKYSSYLIEGSWIALHDYTSFPGVNRAVDEFVQSLPQKPTFYPLLNQNGLALIHLRSAITAPQNEPGSSSTPGTF